MNKTIMFGNTKMEYSAPKISYDIDDVLYEMEETGLIPEMKGPYNIVNEMRSYFGEEKFMEFLEYSNRVWGNNLASLRDIDEENWVIALNRCHCKQ